jgi:uncharacterized protein YkwD
MKKLVALLLVLCACGREQKPIEKDPAPKEDGSKFPFPLPFPIPDPGKFPIPMPTPGQGGNTGDNKIPDSAVVKNLLDEVNAARKSRGLSEISFDSKLDCAAGKHASDIGPKRICGHTGSDGSSPWQRASRCNTSANGEIVACGQGDAKGAVQAWTFSPGHAAIMYDPGQKAFGGGMVNNYWVVIFRK